MLYWRKKYSATVIELPSSSSNRGARRLVGDAADPPLPLVAGRAHLLAAELLPDELGVLGCEDELVGLAHHLARDEADDVGATSSSPPGRPRGGGGEGAVSARGGEGGGSGEGVGGEGGARACSIPMSVSTIDWRSSSHSSVSVGAPQRLVLRGRRRRRRPGRSSSKVAAWLEHDVEHVHHWRSGGGRGAEEWGVVWSLRGVTCHASRVACGPAACRRGARFRCGVHASCGARPGGSSPSSPSARPHHELDHLQAHRPERVEDLVAVVRPPLGGEQVLDELRLALEEDAPRRRQFELGVELHVALVHLDQFTEIGLKLVSTCVTLPCIP